MKNLFVMDPLDRLDFAHDSTWMMMRECSRRGDVVAWCHPASLYGRGGRGCARAQRVVALSERPYFELGDFEEGPLDAYDVVWMRKDPPFDMTYIFATYLLSHTTALVVNNPAGLRDRNEKLFAFGYADLTPETLFTQDISRILAFAKAQPDKIVLKPWDGNGGRGVLVTRHGDPNLRSMAEILTKEGTTAVIAQRYLPEIKQGDKRILLIEGEPVGAMLRVPTEADHRGNMHAGAGVVKTTLNARDQEICARIGPTLRQEGFVFVGIDVIGGWLTEINVTSPTGIQDINQLDGVAIEQQLYDAVARRRQGSHAAV
jgi:glutathione synthase